jgi:hypothetical protein
MDSNLWSWQKVSIAWTFPRNGNWENAVLTGFDGDLNWTIQKRETRHAEFRVKTFTQKQLKYTFEKHEIFQIILLEKVVKQCKK